MLFRSMQLDMEASFVTQEDVLSFVSEAIKDSVESITGERPGKIPTMTWHDAMERFGSDKPDLRIDWELVSIDDLMANVDFKVFSGPAKDPDSRVAALRVPGGASLSRKEIDDYTDYVGIYGAKGLAWIKVNDISAGLEGLQSPIIKFMQIGRAHV